MNRSDCEALDRADPLAPKRSAFSIPEGLIYLDGNSLGVLPRNVSARVKDVAEKQAIVSALSKAKGNKTAAANELNIHRTVLYDKMRKHGIL